MNPEKHERRRWYQHDRPWETLWDSGTLIRLYEVRDSRNGDVARWNFETVYTSNNYEQIRATFGPCTREEAEIQAEEYCRSNYPVAEEDKVESRKRTWESLRKSDLSGYTVTILPSFSITYIVVSPGFPMDEVSCRLHAGDAMRLLDKAPWKEREEHPRGIFSTFFVPPGYGLQVAKKLRGDTPAIPIVLIEGEGKETIY